VCVVVVGFLDWLWYGLVCMLVISCCMLLVVKCWNGLVDVFVDFGVLVVMFGNFDGVYVGYCVVLLWVVE